MVAGLTPAAIVEPTTVSELSQCVADLCVQNKAFAFSGGGTELELGNPPRSLDTLVQTTACDRVVHYAPQDQTISVEAGMTLGAVNRILASERQFLAIDVPDPDRTTVGGAIATNAFGRRRLRYGSIKDTIVGIDFVRPDGIRARGGGRVVKNVAGFDMPKLFVGSLGTLGAIVGATFRVHPIEEHRAALTFSAVTVEQMTLLCRELVSEALVPAAVVAFDAVSGDGYDCSVTFEGFERGVKQQMDVAKSIAHRLRLNVEAESGAFDASFDAREHAVRRDAAWRITLSARPSELLHFLGAPAFSIACRRVIYPLLGIAFIGAENFDAKRLAAWRTTLAGGSVIVTAMPLAARTTVEAWGPPSAGAFVIMRRLKTTFDPKNLCNAGRFVGGL